jgi:hypothetical protein
MHKIIEVEITKLKDSFDIRNTLNQDHVLFLWSLIDAGTELPPIKITKDFSIIDGRHRRIAYEHAGIPMIKAEVVDTDSTIEIVKQAIEANMGGALPPTKTDLYRTMMILINRKYSKERITDEFKSILPMGLIRISYHQARWQINNKKVNEAIDLIKTSNLTVKKAAEIVGISENSIKEKLDRKKIDGNGNPHLKGTLSKMFTHFNKSLGKIVSKTFQDCEDGELTKLETEAILKFLAKLIVNQNRMYADWQKRWDYKK